MRPLLKADLARVDRVHDVLGQLPALATLEASVARMPTPACVAVYGPWGSGKTTLMRSAWLARREAGAPTVWFDPWPHERSRDVIGPLLHAVLRSVEGDPDRTDRAIALASGVAKALLHATIRLGGAAAVGVDPSKAAARLSPKEFDKYFTKWARDADSVDAVRARFRQLVDHALDGQPAEARLVICLDDLDRCLPDSVVSLIEAIKLLMCGDPNTRAVFVFALDRQIVGEAIRQRYPGATSFAGENYLEKIFDLALEVPPVDEMNVRHFVVQALNGRLDLAQPFASSARSDGLGLLLEVLALPMFANPRVITRVLNRLDLLLAVPARAERITAVDDPNRLRQWLLWLAGAERYRGFRYYMRRASDLELAALDAHDPSALSAEGRRLYESPGFRQFLAELGQNARSPKLKRALTRSPGGSLSTLADFDRLLRSAGL